MGPISTREEELDRLPETVQMRRDLQDPARRIAVRAEYKQGLPRFYPDIREQLQLTAEQEDRLFDLLANFQLRHLDIFYTQESDHFAKMKRIQENEQRRNEALRSLLGPDTLEKYGRYQLEGRERQVVARLARWLDPADALSPEQKSQLISVLKAEREQTTQEFHKRARQILQAALPKENSAAQLLEANIRANEDSLREVEAASRRLLQHAASFLSAPQLATLTKMENQKLEAQRRSIESLRTQRTSANTAVQRTSFAVIRAVRLPDNPEDPG
jgi:hypothetical protein